jgi:hypothetical protein
MTNYIVYLSVSIIKKSIDAQKLEILKKFNPIKKYLKKMFLEKTLKTDLF